MLWAEKGIDGTVLLHVLLHCDHYNTYNTHFLGQYPRTFMHDKCGQCLEIKHCTP